jgi:branched-chain amino acid transport system substrate-binding protein
MKIRIGLSLSLSGRYSAMGRQAEAALRIFAATTNDRGGIRVGGEPRDVELVCIDDQSDAVRAVEIYRWLCFENPCDLILGPYSSLLARAAAPIASEGGRVLVNHGGADDDLYSRGDRMIVGVLSPASSYMIGFVRLLAALKFWRKRVAIVAAPTPFARAISDGVERECEQRYVRRRRVKIRVKWNAPFDPIASPSKLFPALRRNRVNAVLSAGSYAHDLAVVRAIVAANLNVPVLGCVAAGVSAFGVDLGAEAAGIVGPSQWEESVLVTPELGLSTREFVRAIRPALRAEPPDYTAAQAYAAGALAARAIECADSLDQQKIRDAFSDLRTTTLFGDFQIDRVTGRQLGHRMLLVQWHEGHKMVIEPESHADTGEIEFPAGWKLILAGFEMLKLNRDRDDHNEEERKNGA